MDYVRDCCYFYCRALNKKLRSEKRIAAKKRLVELLLGKKPQSNNEAKSMFAIAARCMHDADMQAYLKNYPPYRALSR